MEGKASAGLRVFLSYRRDDSAAYTGRLYDTLSTQLGAGVFMDVDAIPLGSDFVDEIHTALRDCDVVLVMIGPIWISHHHGRFGATTPRPSRGLRAPGNRDGNCSRASG